MQFIALTSFDASWPPVRTSRLFYKDHFWLYARNFRWGFALWSPTSAGSAVTTWTLGCLSLRNILRSIVCEGYLCLFSCRTATVGFNAMFFSRRPLRPCSVGPLKQITEHFNPDKLPVRELPHGNVANLYLLFTAWCRAKQETPSSRSTFYDVYQQWSVCLKFHKRSTHSMCKTCSELKCAIHEAKETWLFVVVVVKQTLFNI